MREIPDGLAAHLQREATTLCRCWSLTRRDGEVMGFTDHDRPLAFDGISFAAVTGLEAAESASPSSSRETGRAWHNDVRPGLR